jgi:hypothetical protein
MGMPRIGLYYWIIPVILVEIAAISYSEEDKVSIESKAVEVLTMEKKRSCKVFDAREK